MVGIDSGTVRLMSVTSVERASSGIHCVMTRAWPGYRALWSGYNSFYAECLTDSSSGMTCKGITMRERQLEKAYRHSTRSARSLESIELLHRICFVDMRRQSSQRRIVWTQTKACVCGIWRGALDARAYIVREVNVLHRHQG